jgi:hypothetical protein
MERVKIITLPCYPSPLKMEKGAWTQPGGMREFPEKVKFSKTAADNNMVGHLLL